MKNFRPLTKVPDEHSRMGGTEDMQRRTRDEMTLRSLVDENRRLHRFMTEGIEETSGESLSLSIIAMSVVRILLRWTIITVSS